MGGISGEVGRSAGGNAGISWSYELPHGDRSALGNVTYGDALQLWLTMRQPDQAEKLEAIGYDAITFAELDEFLPADVIHTQTRSLGPAPLPLTTR